LKIKRRHKLAILGGGDDAGAFTPLARHLLINALALGGAAIFTVQAVIHAAFIQKIYRATVQAFQ
jgi:hypothetical protein